MSEDECRDSVLAAYRLAISKGCYQLGQYTLRNHGARGTNGRISRIRDELIAEGKIEVPDAIPLPPRKVVRPVHAEAAIVRYPRPIGVGTSDGPCAAHIDAYRRAERRWRVA